MHCQSIHHSSMILTNCTTCLHGQHPSGQTMPRCSFICGGQNGRLQVSIVVSLDHQVVLFAGCLWGYHIIQIQNSSDSLLEYLVIANNLNMNTHVHDNLVQIPVCFTTFKKINEAIISVSLHNAGSTSRAPSKTHGPNFSQVQFKSFQTSSFGLPGVFVLRFFGNCAYLCKQIDTITNLIM